ncbi:hypothetical protein V6N11_022843 [Hibiscus sabdariffa]|uniref:RNase H type-1 domain-containing protein n=1 Tax=Hibiscus sabdariffa TaxID=183260 RepID=A0ABR2TKE0_9ROSI
MGGSPAGIAKFNMNGAVKGGFGPAKVGGVLRDHTGNVLMKFSNFIGIDDHMSAEFLAIKKTLSLFSSSGMAGGVCLQVETDYSNVVAWFRHPSTTSNAFKVLVIECVIVYKDLNWDLILVDRMKNTLTDKLAKMRIDSSGTVEE